MSSLSRSQSEASEFYESTAPQSIPTRPRGTQRTAAKLASRRIEGKLSDLDTAGYKQLPVGSQLRTALLA